MKALTWLLLAAPLLSQEKPQQQKPLIDDYFKANISAPPVELALDPFYQKFTSALGIPITSSEKVPDAALLVARDIVIHMLAKRSDIRDAMVNTIHTRVAVMATTEMTMDLPEQRNWKKPARDDRRLTRGERENYDSPTGIGSMTDAQYWNRRARGMGGMRLTSCAEENLLGYPGTRYYGENIFVHEFSHAIHGVIRQVDRPLADEIETAYKDAMSKGLWKGQYGETTSNEYWAEGTQTWFWSNYEFKGAPGEKMIQTPDDLKAYDPKLYELLSRVYPDHHIPMDVYYAKNIRPTPRRPQ
jgi:hypothetical protein